MVDRERVRSLAISIGNLARFALGLEPKLAEQHHSAMMAIAKYEGQFGPLREKWVRCGGPGHGYIWGDAQGTSGMFKRELPPEIPESDVVEIPYDSEAEPILSCIERLFEILERIGPANVIEFVGEVVARVKRCYAEDFEAKTLFQLGQRGLTCLGLPDHARQFVGDTIRTQTRAHLELQTTGCLLGKLFAGLHLASALDDGQAGGSTGMGFLDYQMALAARPSSFMGIFGWLMSAPEGAFDLYLGNTLQRCVREGPIANIASAAQNLRLVGEEFLHDALEAQSLESSQEMLFAAIPRFYGANILLDFLKDSPHVADVQQREDFERFAVKGCEEKVVRCNSALHNATLDGSGLLLREFQKQVRLARERGGALAAEKLVTEYIELRFLYPRCWRGVLHGTARSGP